MSARTEGGAEEPATNFADWSGRLIAGRFHLETFVGTGTFGAVFKGSDHRFPGRDVAIKVGVGVPKHDHFFREARLLGQLNSEYIVSVYEYGQDEGLPYIVMEFLHGRTLADLLNDADGHLSADLISQCIDEVGRALSSLHSVNLIHRDLKPENIMLVDVADSLSHGEVRQRFKIIDFGISSKIDADDSRRNTTFDGAGTPEFMAPEQLLSEPVSARSDVYSLGVLIFVLYSGRVPFQSAAASVSALADLVSCVLNNPPPKLSEAVSADVTVPAALDQLVASCLAKDPRDRPSSVADVCLKYREIFSAADVVPEAASVRKPSRQKRRRRSRASLLLGLTLTAVVAASPVFLPKFIHEREAPNNKKVSVVGGSARSGQSGDAEPGSVGISEVTPPVSVVPPRDKSAQDVPPSAVSRAAASPSEAPASAVPPKTEVGQFQTEPPTASGSDGQVEPVTTSEAGSGPGSGMKASENSPAPVPPPVPWCPDVFTESGPPFVSGGRRLPKSILLTKQDIAFVLVAPEQFQSAVQRSEAPGSAFYISERPVSIELYTSVTGETPALPAASPSSPSVPPLPESAAIPELPEVSLDKLDVDDLISILQDSATKKSSGGANEGVVEESSIGPETPVTNLTWYQADRFCRRLSDQSNSELSKDKSAALQFRLPQQFEWWAAAGYFSADHAPADLVPDPSPSGVRELARLGFEWTCTSENGHHVQRSNNPKDTVRGGTEISEETMMMTPGRSTKRLSFGMINGARTLPAGQPAGPMTTFRIVLEVPELGKQP
ncbi:MAG: serine/threonine-protein kinase [Fuerstiella sp.]